VGRATSRATQQPTPVIPDAPAVSDTVPTLPEAPADELPALVDQRIQDLSELPDVSASAPVEAADIPEQIADLTDQGQSRLGPSDTESVSPRLRNSPLSMEPKSENQPK
jgi:hypothetical protein